MKRFTMLLSGLLLATIGFNAMAQSAVSGSAGVAVNSREDFRGQEYSTGVSVDAFGKVTYDSFYVAGDFTKVGNSFPVNASGAKIRSDVGVGYTFHPTDSLGLDVSVNHVYNSPEFLVKRDGKTVLGAYSEFRVKATYDVLFAEVGQAFGPEQNTYAKVGAEYPINERVKVGAAVSAFHYSTAVGNQNKYNNSEVFASVNLVKGLDVYGKYSFGGRASDKSVLSNYGIVGVSYKL